jgi:histidyl-tRNA synthetase
MQALPGFREFYPADCARRNYILDRWRATARRYGFVEYDGPVVEPLALYEKKSGGELAGQMFTVAAAAEPGEIKGVLRPEMTPTLARMVASREREFKKPLKWFCVPSFFRHERQQRGRLREFHQLNCDIIGEASPAADAELIALAIDLMRDFGLSSAEVVVRISSRAAWQRFFAEAGGAPGEEYDFFQVVDKFERMPREKSEAALSRWGIPVDRVLGLMHSREPGPELSAVFADLEARELREFAEVDYAIVRGLAYYTGTVFEVFDRAGKERAIAGGGRYDSLLSQMSDGRVGLPALGFGMGDVVLGNLLDEVPAARERMAAWISAQHPAEVYVVIAAEERRPEALGVVQRIRAADVRTDYALTPAKVGKQLQSAEERGAKCAVIVGNEWPVVKVKQLASREEREVPVEALAAELKSTLEEGRGLKRD